MAKKSTNVGRGGGGIAEANAGHDFFDDGTHAAEAKEILEIKLLGKRSWKIEKCYSCRVGGWAFIEAIQ